MWSAGILPAVNAQHSKPPSPEAFRSRSFAWQATHCGQDARAPYKNLMATSSRNSGRARPQHSRQNEIVSILLLALGLLLFLCLITYNPNDPSSNAASQEARRTFIGVIGSETAVRFLQTFGLIAYILPALIVLIAWQCFKSLSLRVSVMSVVAFLLFVLSLVGLMGLTDYKVFDSSVYVGGIIGYFIGWLLVPWITKIGAFILLVAVGIASFIYITNFSLTIVFADVRHYAEMLIGWIRNHPALEAEALSKSDQGTPVEALYAAENKHAKKLRDDAKDGGKDGTGKKLGAAISGLITKLGEPPKGKEVKGEAAQEIGEIKEEKKPAPTIIARDIKPAKPAGTKEEFKPKEIMVSEERDTPPLDLDAIDATIEGRADLSGKSDAAEEAKTQPEFAAEEQAPKPAPKKKAQNFDKYTLPKSEFLTEPPPATEQREEELKAVAQELEAKCNEFKVGGRVAVIRQGPVVTTYEFKPDSGVKYSRITGLTDDLALALKAQSIRIDRIPGKAYVGIEVPNPNRETIFLREVIESAKFDKSESKLTIALGKKIDGENYVTDLVKMPHLLIAGAT